MARVVPRPREWPGRRLAEDAGMGAEKYSLGGFALCNKRARPCRPCEAVGRAARMGGPPGQFRGEGRRVTHGKDGPIVAVPHEILAAHAVANHTRTSAVQRLRNDEPESLL